MLTPTQPPSAAELGLMRGCRPTNDRLVAVENWAQPPFNRWSLQHMRELGPTAAIARGEGPASDLQEVRLNLGDLRVAGFDGGEMMLAELLSATYTDALLVLHRGCVVVEEYFNGMMPSTLHNLQSVSKSLTGTLAGLLIASGRLDPDEQVTGYITELKGSSWDGARVRDLLDMRTGTRWTEEDADPHGPDGRSYDEVVGWAAHAETPDARDLYTYIAGLENCRPHGGPFDYRSIVTDLLGWVLESAGGCRFADLLSRELWARLGAEHDAEVMLDRHGHPLACGGISTTLRDLARFGRCHLADDRWAGRDLVPSSWVDDCWRGSPDTAEAFRRMPPSRRRDRFGVYHMYRNQWWVPFAERATLLGLGAFGQALYVDLPSQCVIVWLSSWPEASIGEFVDAQTRTFEAIVGALAVAP